MLYEIICLQAGRQAGRQAAPVHEKYGRKKAIHLDVIIRRHSKGASGNDLAILSKKIAKTLHVG